MSDMKKILMIDDNKDRKQIVNNLNKQQKIKNIVFEYIHPEDLVLSDLINFDLLFVDYRLSAVPNESNKRYKGKSLSLIGNIRENEIFIPVYSYTLDPEDREFLNLKEYVEMFSERIIKLEDIRKNGILIASNDTKDYTRILNNIKEEKKLIQLLNPPDYELKKISKILPDVIKKSFYNSNSDKEKLVLEFTNWIFEEFFEYPGFLYNKKFISIKLGISEDYFESKKEMFSDAKYDGIFSKTFGKALWWKSKIIEMLTNILKDKDLNYFTNDIRKIFISVYDVKNEDKSKCVVCDGFLPDTLGYDIRGKSWYPVHYKCSEPNNMYKNRSYYDELRQFNMEKS